MTDEKFELSRRQMLAGVGTIGAVSAGAGLGTTALFSDEESFEDNSITAGTLDMKVQAQLVAASSEYESAIGDLVYDETADGEPEEGVTLGYSLSDFKPGDWVIICYEISINDNPGYVAIHGGEFSQGGGTTTEPEPTPDNGELADNLLLTHWNGASVSTSDISSREDLVELSQTTNLNSTEPMGGSWGEPDIDGNATLGGGDEAQYTDVLEFLFGADQNPNNVGGVPNETTQLGNGYGSTDGVVIRNPTDGSEGGIGGPGTDVREVGDSENSENPDSVTFCQLLELPREVGNEVQGDSLEFDLAFKTVQTRHVGTTYSDLSDNIREYPFENQVDGTNEENNIPSST
ncbi:SipW-dependent-type signal peptide-containing protein [Halobellus rufus]|uniref:SipW-dependent-type signal peptide-containing protein n=1 Tax=Halobellus rufus TaxID=1448860 RepID=UPI000678D9CC|nr:SipW-dependent-type signal peptide-containing protein [Halobellus rufus]